MMFSLLLFSLNNWLLLVKCLPSIASTSTAKSDATSLLQERQYGSSSWSSSWSSYDFCSDNHFACGDGTCIPPDWECDWYYDCPDDTDEHVNCQYNGNARCSGGKPIASSWVCDGFQDCAEGEDELDTFCANRTCNGQLCDQIQCIADDELCNGVFDCNDQSDEDPQVCERGCFLCDNGAQCIPLDWQCDSVADCDDITDESDRICGPVYQRCWEEAFPCKNNFYCVPQKWRCDGENDCGDLSDEVNCERDSSWHETNGWSDWSSWADCSTECGLGVRNRNRECVTNNPLKPCVGEEEETEDCREQKGCPGDLGVTCGHKFEDKTLDVETRIVGGKRAVHGDWPWQAQLLWLQGGNKYVSCGGTLVHPNIVVGAAHCFMQHMIDRTRWLVHLGKHDIYADDLEDYEIERRIAKIEIHPNFNPRTMRNDIAILVLDAPVLENPSKHIRWACLDHGFTIDNGECFISGWGVTKMGGKQAVVLKEANMPILNRGMCNSRDVYGGLVKDSMLCAGHMEGGTDACQGDSGGPLSCKNPADGLWYLVGITSWGHGCALANRPGVFTNVRYFADWVIETVEKYT